MDENEQKKLFERFDLPYWDELPTERYLIAIMRKLADIEDAIAEIRKVRPKNVNGVNLECEK